MAALLGRLVWIIAQVVRDSNRATPVDQGIEAEEHYHVTHGWLRAAAIMDAGAAILPQPLALTRRELCSMTYEETTLPLQPVALVV